ncbi:hypothetical protein J1N35_034386 [Gossypium stocksii]|uniref:RNase H type-1 domain-containing protein n=1 Tax=Gossypium stocksii TaxID=47602 RepID=A0A9D3US83_9ROSI|nr:hypothetical protein J1N35_034386 [Gossypium stocksii]
MCYTDMLPRAGAVKPGGKYASIGEVFWDHKGRWIIGFSQFLGSGSMFHANYGRYFKEYCNKQWESSFHHISKEGNRVANALAKVSVVGWFELQKFPSPSHNLLQLLRTDLDEALIS